MFYVAVPCTSTNTNGEILVIDPRTQSVDNVYALPTSGDMDWLSVRARIYSSVSAPINRMSVRQTIS